MGHFGRSTVCPAGALRAFSWMARMSSTHFSSTSAIFWCIGFRIVAFDHMRRPSEAAKKHVQLFAGMRARMVGLAIL